MSSDPSFPSRKSRFSDLERLSFALQAAQVGTWDMDLERKQVWWDERCRELYGFVREVEVPYEIVLEYIHPDDQTRVDQAIAWALNPKSLGDYDIEFRTIGGEDYKLRWVHAKGQAFFDEHGNAYRFSGIIQDITSLVLARQELESNRRHWSTIVENSPAPTAVLAGRELTIETINKSMLQILGKEASVIGQPLLEAVPEFTDQPFMAILQDVFRTGNAYHTSEGNVYIKVGDRLQEFWFSYSYTPLFNQKGRVVSIVCTAIDITALIEIRRQITTQQPG
ncbi:hypothetical protein BWI93_10360 [Siphonobacter sp. BAB-5385]|uniref:PAS domain-containing protein n=1 Tax=Siphonobacter sp. BAB-5385 TaxID=1864822 RepID=UPI000B9E72B9|nr:PAS domain S-box protein [Siphonobacter sp. BAB-5385]OZI08260.1 hypothetical protein BWI93_10360 [Siphonobacter sp. BAB-5385]